MINILTLNRIASSLDGRGFYKFGRRGAIRMLTLSQGTGSSTQQPPIAPYTDTILFSSGLRFGDDARFEKSPLTQWRIDVETRALLRLIPYVDQYAKSETSVLKPLKAKFLNEFSFELELVKPIGDLTNEELKTLLEELRLYVSALYGLLRHFEGLSGSEVQRIPSNFLKYLDEEIRDFFDRLSYRYIL